MNESNDSKPTVAALVMVGWIMVLIVACASCVLSVLPVGV